MSISVVVPVYNRGPRVRKTLDSIQAQTLAPLEIIVVDDGSTDGTSDWIEEHYGDQIRVIRQPNGGVANARNRGLQEARGEYIAFLDHDDIWLPRKLEAQLEAARAYPEAALIGCNWRDIKEDGALWDDERWSAVFAEWRPMRGMAYDWVCAMPCPIISMTLPLLRTDSLRAVGGFDSACVPCDDWDLYLRLAHRFSFEWVDETLACYVHHNAQQSGDYLLLATAMNRVLRKQWPVVLKHPRSVNFWWSFGRFTASAPFYYRAKESLQAGRSFATLREIARVALRHPFALCTKQWIYLVMRLTRRQFGPY